MKFQKIHKIVASTVIFTALFGTTIASANTTSSGKPFSWDNASVYFALTDRFNNGDTSNDHSYGRGLDQNGNVQAGYTGNPGAFQGGDLKGLTQKIESGYFTNLGVNAIWITPPYEQIHGFTSGNDAGGNATSNGKGFPYYSYHGYWALDYTNIDANMGTAADFKNFVDAAHAKGIRVVMDIVLNHVGYTTMKDANDYNFGGLASGWKNYYYGPLTDLVGGATEASTYYDNTSPKWATNWWGSDFLRSSAGYSGYPIASQGAGWTNCLAGLPDIKTESTTEVALPPLLANKWKSEGRYDTEMASLNEFFQSRSLPKTPRNYVIKWLTDYIKNYGVDGFRCDTANQVDLDSWAALNKEARVAFDAYKTKNPDKVLDPMAKFWTVGESWGHGTTKDAFYTQGGFDAMINFGFKGAATSNIQAKYDDLSKVNDDDSFNVLSYISSHDDTLSDRANTIDGGTSLLLAPGAVQIFYGDETARPLGWTDRFTSDYSDQRYRTFMNWSDLNNSSSTASKSLTHWQKLGQFRNNHLAVGAGANTDLSSSPYTFGRVYNKDGVLDKVVCEVGASGTVDVKVSGIFADGALVRDAYTGNTTTVVNGKATFTDGGNKVILIEKGNNSPEVSISPSKTKYFTDTLDLTLYVSGADNGTYSINGGAATSFVNGQKITIGAGLSYEDATTINVNASNSDGLSSQTYTYTKKDPNFVSKIYFKKPSTWGTPKAYVYSESTGNKVSAWPGIAMTSEGDSLYSYSLPAGFTDALVIFTDGSNQTPGVGQKGLSLADGSVMLYDNGTWAEYDEGVTASISQDSCSFTGSLTLTLKTKNSTSATYSINGGTATSYTDGQTITIGQDAAIGSKITVAVTAANGSKTATKTYTYTKAAVVASSVVYFYNTSSWSNPYVYVYSGSGTTATKVAAWPGIAMTKVSDGLYSYTIPEGFGDAKVIFSNNGSSQVPASGSEGYSITTGGSMEYKNGTWQTHEVVTVPTVSSSTEDSSFIDSLTLTLSAKNSTSATYSVNNGTPTSYTDGQTITIGKDVAIGSTTTVTLIAINGTNTATKTYTYTKAQVVTAPTVSVSTEDSSFIDSLTLTLSTKNSTSATYSVNNGTATSYTDGQTITIGKDAAIGSKTTVTLAATDGTNTVTKTYTYTKAQAATASTVYFNNTNNWSNPYVYVYSGSGTTATKVAAWPGIAMTKVSGTLYSYTIPEGFGDAKVIFSNNGSSQVPASGAEGYSITAGSSMEYNNGTWQAYQVVASSKVYFSNTNSWSNPYVYVYSGSGTTATKVAAWPGIAMTKGSDGLYSYTISAGFGDAKVIFSNNGSSQVPASGAEGYSITSGSSMVYNNGSWLTYA